MTGTIQTIRGVMQHRIDRYRRLAIAARQDRDAIRAGYTVATLFVFVGMLDAISTNWALSVGAYEVNGFMRGLQTMLGDFWFIPKMMMQAAVGAMIVWCPNKPTVMIMALMTTWTATIVCNNFVIAHLMSQA